MPNVSLGKKFEKYLDTKVRSGEFASASEVIRDALRDKMRNEAEDAAKLEALRRDIDAGWKQADRGKFVDFDAEEINLDLDNESQSDRRE